MKANRTESRRSRRLRSVALLLAGILVGVLLISPATAGVSPSLRHFWTSFIKPKLSTAGTINKAGNPVDWTRLKNVPPDFADGVDNTGGTPGPATDLQCTGCVTSKDMGAISVRSATISVQGALGGSTGTVTAFCGPGERAISGGGSWDAASPALTILGSEFASGPFGVPLKAQGWTVIGGNSTGASHVLTAQVLCLSS